MPYNVVVQPGADEGFGSLPSDVAGHVLAELYRLQNDPESITRPSHYSELDRLFVMPPYYSTGCCYIVKATVQLRGNLVRVTQIAHEKVGFET